MNVVCSEGRFGARSASSIIEETKAEETSIFLYDESVNIFCKALR
ncbi:hypothetical protein [Peribacillus sp. NJ4]|nr:hypothetical protein [Peribacillus sp. NJ4]